MRIIDYYVKGLDFKIRQEIFSIMEDINPVLIKDLLEKEIGYPSFKLRGASDEVIQEYVSDAIHGFMSVNDVMQNNNRYPLFSNASDSYASAKEYVELMKKRELEELKKVFGCTWEEYQPKYYDPKEGKKISDPTEPNFKVL